jgi:hypothetical protein
VAPRPGGLAGLHYHRPAEKLARALADHFRAQQFEAQVFRTSGDRAAMQARKESLWRHLLGVGYALTVVIGRVAVPPVLLGTAHGIWKENLLGKEVWQVIDERVSAPTEAGP